MKRLIATLAAGGALFPLWGYETGGKLAVGVRSIGQLTPSYAAFKYGISDWLGVEPSLSASRLTDRDSSAYGPPRDTTYLYEYDTRNYTGELLFELKPVRKETSNLVLRLGGGYSFGGYHSSDRGSQWSKSSSSAVSLLFGLGVERKILDLFALYAGLWSSYTWSWYSSESSSGAKVYRSTGDLDFGNSLYELGLVWYLD